MNKNHDKPENEGEGNRTSDRRYRQGVGDFAKSGKVDDAAKKAAKDVDKNDPSLREAELAGKARVAEEDPAAFERNDDALRYGLHAALQVVHEGDWNDELDRMLAHEWERLHGGVSWEDVRPLVKQGWLQGRSRMGKA
jgi:hypothetical protein